MSIDDSVAQDQDVVIRMQAPLTKQHGTHVFMALAE